MDLLGEEVGHPADAGLGRQREGLGKQTCRGMCCGGGSGVGVLVLLATKLPVAQWDAQWQGNLSRDLEVRVEPRPARAALGHMSYLLLVSHCPQTCPCVTSVPEFLS